MVSKKYFFSNNLIDLSKKAAILEKEEEFYIVRVEKLKKLAKTGSRLLPAIAGILNLK